MHARTLLLSCAFPLLVGLSCKRSDAPAPAAQPSSPPASAAETPATEPAASEPAAQAGPPAWVGPIDPDKTGVLRGVVRFEGTPPPRVPVPINATGCLEHSSPPLFETVIVNDGKLQNVFVTISKGLDKVELPPASGEVVLDQRGCLYTPHVLAMRVGQTLRVHNSDQTTHNVNVRESRNATPNQVQAPGSPAVEWTPKKAEAMVAFACDLHPWMKAFVCVAEHPFYAVTDEHGAFEIRGLPPGSYTLVAEHEKYKKQTLKFTLQPKGEAQVEITYKP